MAEAEKEEDRVTAWDLGLREWLYTLDGHDQRRYLSHQCQIMLMLSKYQKIFVSFFYILSRILNILKIHEQPIVNMGLPIVNALIR